MLCTRWRSGGVLWRSRSRCPSLRVITPTSVGCVATFLIARRSYAATLPSLRERAGASDSPGRASQVYRCTGRASDRRSSHAISASAHRSQRPDLKLNVEYILALFDPTFSLFRAPSPFVGAERVPANTIVDIDSSGRAHARPGPFRLGPELKLPTRELARALRQGSRRRSSGSARGRVRRRPDQRRVDSSNLLAAAVHNARQRNTADIIPVSLECGGISDRPHLTAMCSHLGIEALRVSPSEGVRYARGDASIDGSAYAPLRYRRRSRPYSREGRGGRARSARRRLGVAPGRVAGVFACRFLSLAPSPRIALHERVPGHLSDSSGGLADAPAFAAGARILPSFALGLRGRRGQHRAAKVSRRHISLAGTEPHGFPQRAERISAAPPDLTSRRAKTSPVSHVSPDHDASRDNLALGDRHRITHLFSISGR